MLRIRIRVLVVVLLLLAVLAGWFIFRGRGGRRAADTKPLEPKQVISESFYLSYEGEGLGLGYINLPEAQQALSIIGRLEELRVEQEAIYAEIDFGWRGKAEVMLAKAKPELDFVLQEQEVKDFFPTSDKFKLRRLKWHQVEQALQPYIGKPMIFSLWVAALEQRPANVSAERFELIKKLRECNQQLAEHLRFGRQKPGCKAHINQAAVYIKYAR